jgi:hypothetical protein
LLNVGIWRSKEPLPFYVNKANGHWSSFDPQYGCRDGTPYEVVEVDCVTIADLLEKFGVPRYMKIDVEGADKIILEQLRLLRSRPKFISVEEYGVNCIVDLKSLGYTQFCFTPQADKAKLLPPHPPCEGVYVEKKFSDKDSGLFGDEIAGPWLSFTDALDVFTRTIRRADHSYVAPPYQWYDVHARRPVVRYAQSGSAEPAEQLAQLAQLALQAEEALSTCKARAEAAEHRALQAEEKEQRLLGDLEAIRSTEQRQRRELEILGGRSFLQRVLHKNRIRIRP